MNAMSHDVPNMIGVNSRALAEKMRQACSRLHGDGRDRHGRHDGDGDMSPAENTLPMMTGQGPVRPDRDGRHVHVLKVRAGLSRAMTIRAGIKIRAGTVASPVLG